MVVEKMFDKLKDVTIGQWAAVSTFVLGLSLTLSGAGAAHYWGLAILLTPLWWQTYFVIKPKMVVKSW